MAASRLIKGSGIDWEQCRYRNSSKCAVIQRLKDTVLDERQSIIERSKALFALRSLLTGGEDGHALMHGAGKAVFEVTLQHSVALMTTDGCKRPDLVFEPLTPTVYRGMVEIGCPLLAACGERVLKSGFQRSSANERSSTLTLLFRYACVLINTEDSPDPTLQTLVPYALQELRRQRVVEYLYPWIETTLREQIDNVAVLCGIKACSITQLFVPKSHAEAMEWIGYGALEAIAMATEVTMTATARHQEMKEAVIEGLADQPMSALAEQLSNIMQWAFTSQDRKGLVPSSSGDGRILMDRLDRIDLLGLVQRLIAYEMDLENCVNLFFWTSIYSARTGVKRFLPAKRAIIDTVIRHPRTHYSDNVGDGLRRLVVSILSNVNSLMKGYAVRPWRLGTYLVDWLGVDAIPTEEADVCLGALLLFMEVAPDDSTDLFEELAKRKPVAILRKLVRRDEFGLTWKCLRVLRYFLASHPKAVRELSKAFEVPGWFVRDVKAGFTDKSYVVNDLIGLMAVDSVAWKEISQGDTMESVVHALQDTLEAPAQGGTRCDSLNAISQLMALHAFLSHDECRARFQRDAKMRQEFMVGVGAMVFAAEHKGKRNPGEAQDLRRVLATVMDYAYAGTAAYDKTWINMGKTLVLMGTRTPDSDAEILGLIAVAIWNYSRNAMIAREMVKEGGLAVLHRAAAHPNAEIDDFVEEATRNLRIVARAK